MDAENELMAGARILIAKSPGRVYEAIVDPEQMSGYFITQGSGRLDDGERITWSWSDCGAVATVMPQLVDAPVRIDFLWRPGEPDDPTAVDAAVSIELEVNGQGQTLVKVAEGPWRRDQEGIARALQQTQGWMHMLCCLKAYLEFGINLRA